MKFLIVILLLLPRLIAVGQESTASTEVYKVLSIQNIFNPDYIHKAKNEIQNIITTHQADPHRIAGLYWLAEIYNALNNDDSARMLYTEILNMSIPEKTDDHNYRYNSAKKLAELSIDQKDFCAALNYLDLAKFKFIPRFDCGNSYMDENLDMKILYANCYSGTGEVKRAIDSLAPFMFTAWSGTYTERLVEVLYGEYLKVYTPEEIKIEFLGAEKTLVIKTETYYSHSYRQPAITIFNNEIGLPIYEYEIKSLTVQGLNKQCIELMRQSSIYKLATR